MEMMVEKISTRGGIDFSFAPSKSLRLMLRMDRGFVLSQTLGEACLERGH